MTAGACCPLRLPDGAIVGVRPVIPADKVEALRAFARLSETSRHNRFLTPTPRVSEAQVRYLTDIDYVDHYAWCAGTVQGRGIAIARFVRTGDDIAEAAVTVADEYQNRGLGSLMLKALALIAHDHGLSRFEALVLAENRPMIRIAEKAGAIFDSTSGGVARAEFRISARLWSDLPEAETLRWMARTAQTAA